MDFFTPDLRFGAAYKGDPTTLTELWDATREGQQKIENFNALWRSLEDEVDAVNDRIAKAGGPQQRNPLRDQTTPEERQRLKDVVEGGDGSIAWAQWLRLTRYEEDLKELERQNPHLAPVIQSARPPSLIVAERMHEAEKKRADVYDRRNMVQWNFPGSAFISGPINMIRDPAGMAAIMGGSIHGQLSSPGDILAMIAGNIASAPGKSLLTNAWRNAAANAGTQAFLEPQVQQQRAMAGLEAGLAPALENIAGAAGIGAALDVGIRAPVRAINKARGVQGLGGVFSDAPETPPPARPTDVPTEPERPTPPVDLDPDLLARAEQGDTAAMREIIARVPELQDEPELRGAIAADEINQIAPIRVEGVDEGAGIRTFEQMVRASIDPDEPAPRLPDALPEARVELDPERAARVMAEPGMQRLSEAARQAVDQAMPGVADRLEALIEAGHPRILDLVEDGIKRARGADDAGQAAQAFAREALSLANEIGPARLAALADIHSGLGNPVDIARAFRDMPDINDASLPRTPAVEMARSLSRLSETAFDMVEKGEADPLLAQVVSDHVSDPLKHAGVIDDLKRAGITNPEEARRTIPDLIPPERDPDAMTFGEGIDDPAGKEAAEQVERLKAEYATEMAEHQAKLEARKQQAEAARQAEAERQALIERADAVRDEIRAVMGIVPSDFEVKVFTGMGDLPEAVAAEVMRANAGRFTEALSAFQRATTDAERMSARQAMDLASNNRTIEGMVADDVIWVAAYAMNPQGRVAHESVHALVKSGRLTPDEMRLLAEDARRLGVFDEAREAMYRATYEGRSDVTPARLAEMLDEEAAAHRLEAEKNRRAMQADATPEPEAAPKAAEVEGIIARVQAFLGQVKSAIDRAMGRSSQTAATSPDIDATSPAKAVLDAILSGEIAKREPIIRAMRSEDITAVAVRAAPVEPVARVASPDQFADPVTGDAYTRQDIDGIISMWQYVQDMRRQPEPERLASFVKRMGGVKDDGGDIRSGMGGVRSRPGLVSKTGRELDDAARMAWDAGYLRGMDRPDINAFLDALNEDLNGRPIIREADQAIEEDIRVAREMERELDELGIADFKSEDAIRTFFASQGGSRSEGRPANAGIPVYDDVPFAFADLTSRERAEAAGFETSRVWYHGTSQDFAAFNPGRVLDERAARDRYYADAPRMVFMSSDPSLTSLWASGEGGRVLPLYLRRDTRLFDGARDADALAEFVGQNETAIRERLFNRAGEPDLVAAVQRGDWEILETPPVQEWLRANGYDGFIAVGDMGGRQVPFAAVFDSANARGMIRSTNAAFDASQSDSPNLMFAFAGEKAKTADLDALARAKSMYADGVDRTKIWTDTGWFRGVDGKWRFEIDDSGSRLRRRGDTFEPQWRAVADKQDDYPDLKSLLRHNAIAGAYPSVMGRDVKLLSRSSDFDAQYLNGEFSINRDLPRDQVRPAMLHEGQHAIQDIEQFAQQGKYQRLTDDEYRRMASEVEARAVETRANMTPAERRARPPWEDYDVPESEQIVRFADGSGPMFAFTDPPVTPGLDMSPEARKARAEEMGFDTSRVWYHVTMDDFDKFDLAQAGKNTDYTEFSQALAKAGVWATNVPAEVARGSAMDKYDGSRTIPLYVAGELKEWDGTLFELGNSMSDVLDEAKASGFTGIVLNDDEFGGRSVVIFDPRNIRSVNAAFDPAHADSPNLMFAMADQTQPDQIARLTGRLSTLAQATGTQAPDLQARVSAALNTLATLQEAAAERGVDVNGDGMVNVVDLAQANAGRALSQITDLIGAERTAQIAEDLQTLTRDMPSDPQEIAARINAALDQVMPEEQPRMAANDNQDLGPVSPVERDMFDMERIGQIIELIGVCR